MARAPPLVRQFTMLGGRLLLVVATAMGLTFGATMLVERQMASPLNASAVCLLTAFVLAALAARSVVQPLERLISGLRETARTGCLSADFPEHSAAPELNYLAHTLNRAAQAIRHSQADLDRAYVQLAETMAEALDARDPYTAGHSIRVGAYSYAIARAAGIPAAQAETIRIAAQLHDIGKIGIPDAILQKPDILTEEEYGLIKLHPQIGCKILSKVAKFDQLLPVIELHHENHDGSGYPYRLSGAQVPLEVRIVHVADAFDAMTSDRAHRTALPLSLAIEDLRANSGTQFDPDVVNVFLRLIGDREYAALLEPQLALLAERERIHLRQLAV